MLRIHSVIIETIRETTSLAAEIARKDRDLASQYRRALTSAALNVAEGSNQRGARRGSHSSIALGSAQEAWSALEAAAAWGIAAPSAEGGGGGGGRGRDSLSVFAVPRFS